MMFNICKNISYLCLMFCAASQLFFQQSLASEDNAGVWSGYISGQGRGFWQSPQFDGQRDGDLSLAIEPEYYKDWNNGLRAITFKPFARLDSNDPERSHVDIREAHYLHVVGDWEWRIGLAKVFWGVTESQHLVDIINQTDLVENLDTEDKLGQPMIETTWLQDWGALQFYILPGFRERTFPGRDGRLRTGLVVDTDEGESGAFELIPFYGQINQTGLDLQAIIGNWIWKLESIVQTKKGRDFTAAVGGFEYTFYGVSESGADLGVLSEYHFDDRKQDAPVGFQDDIFFGMRYVWNDAQDTQVLAGGFYDFDYSSKSVRIELQRRFSDSWKLESELQMFSDVAREDPLRTFHRDDYFQIDLAYYF